MFHGVFVSMGIYRFLFILLFPFICLGQKTVDKKWDGRQLDSLKILTDEVYKIDIRGSNTREISLKAVIEGELYQETMVNASISSRTLNITTDLSPYFTPENDKLAAHKVMSVELELIIPETMAVIVNSKLASVNTTGSFEYIAVGLEQGRCKLNEFSGSATLYTIQGDIEIEPAGVHQYRLSSKYGAVLNPQESYGDRLVQAESIYGEIRVIKNQ